MKGPDSIQCIKQDLAFNGIFNANQLHIFNTNMKADLLYSCETGKIQNV